MAYILKRAEVQKKKALQQKETKKKFNKLIRKGSVAAVTKPIDEAERKRRTNEISVVYFKWDMEGDGFVSFADVNRVIITYKSDLWGELQTIYKNRWEALSESGRIPASGLDRLKLIEVFLDITCEANSDYFDEFISHTHDTIDFLNDLTEDGRKKQAVWTLFMEWDADHSGTLEYDELHTVIINAKFFAEHKLGPQHILKAALGTALPVTDNKQQLNEFIEKAKVSNIGLDLQQFHKFIKRLLLPLPNEQFYTAIQQIHQCIEYEKRYYTVNKYLTCGLNSSDRDMDKSSNVGNLVASALKDKGRNEDLKVTRTMKIRSEIKHAFDCITTKDLEDLLNNPQPPQAFELVSTAVCILFKLRPNPLSFESPTDRTIQHFKTLKTLIGKQHLRNFVQTLVNFNTSSVTYNQVQRVMEFYFNPLFDNSRLLMCGAGCWFISSLCTWVKKLVQIACLENDWVYPPSTVQSTDGALSESDMTLLANRTNDSLMITSADGGDNGDVTATSPTTPLTDSQNSPTSTSNPTQGALVPVPPASKKKKSRSGIVTGSSSYGDTNGWSLSTQTRTNMQQSVSWEVLCDTEAVALATPKPPYSCCGINSIPLPREGTPPRLPIIDTMFGREVPKKLLTNKNNFLQPAAPPPKTTRAPKELRPSTAPHRVFLPNPRMARASSAQNPPNSGLGDTVPSAHKPKEPVPLPA